ncbi:MAG: hydroxymethylbilane synthase [Corynebacterium sp.]|nr:hydroxymethylbilane synthase [Corynebacterium sp.]
MSGFRIGTRGSALATTQSGMIRDQLNNHSELVIITTPGDRSQAPVENIGVGVFTHTLRQALLDGDIDIAVHSCKDLPTAPVAGIHTIYPAREIFNEVLISRDNLTLDQLPTGAKVGTSAPRRVGQLRYLRPDLEIRPLRGNVDTRIRKVREGELDAIILAGAGIIRLGRAGEASESFPVDQFLPAPAQGILAVEALAGTDAAAAIDQLSDPAATAMAVAEREVLSYLQAGCTAPIGAHASVTVQSADDQPTETVIELEAGIFPVSETVSDDAAPIRVRATGTDPVTVGRDAAEQLLAAGADQFLEH